MREDMNDEIALALEEHLRRRDKKELLKIDLKKDYNLIKENKLVNNFYYKEIITEPIIPLYTEEELRRRREVKELLKGFKKVSPDILSNSNVSLKPSKSTIELLKEEFLKGSRVLERDTPTFLKSDIDIIRASLKRDISSVRYAIFKTEEAKEIAIEEAKRQGFTFQADTPMFMLQNHDLIKLSAQRDINSINFVPNDVWTNELATFVYSLALKNNYVLSSDSPRFFKANAEIIKQSLKLDSASSIHIIWKGMNPEDMIAIEHYVVENGIDFVLGPRVPINFKRNIEICIRSFKKDEGSLNYVDFEYFKKNNLIGKIEEVLLENQYVLKFDSPEFLKNDTRICLNSIKIDIHSANYLSRDMRYWLTHDLEEFPIENAEDENLRNRLYEIRKYLIENGFYSLEKIRSFSISLLKDDTILEYFLKQNHIAKESEDEKSKIYYERMKAFIKQILFAPVKISELRKVFHMVALKKWETYRQENNDYYTNIFNRICDSLEKNHNFISAINELQFLLKVDDVLDERKYALFNAFIEYHQIYHSSKADNKIELLQEKRDEISRNAALFIAKSKEQVISEQMAELDELYKQFFILRIDNPMVKKKVVEIKQRECLRKKFQDNDANIMKKLMEIKEKYLTYHYHSSINKNQIPQIIDLLISKSIEGTVSSVDDIFSSSKPARFDEYEMYEKISKLVNRLNSHNITIADKEVEKYRDFIFFDGEQYRYKGNRFNEEELSVIMGYKDLKYVFGKIRSEIIKLAKDIDDFGQITEEDIHSLIGECPFTDEFYKFDVHQFNRFSLRTLDDYLDVFEDKKEIIMDDDSYEAICSLTSSGLIATSMITGLGSNSDVKFNPVEEQISSKKLSSLFGNIETLQRLIAKEEFTIAHLDKILELKEILVYADLSQISLLGKDVIKKIYVNNGYTSASQEKRIRVACDLATSMISRDKSTVPYVDGIHGNYRYSMYDPTDMALLTSGLDTNACFRCCGNDNDFLHYCALDKNGFVIKLTDLEGNFIGRASGFRNGNGVYINQLRTIYDKKSSAYASERETIIQAFERACSDIVEASQNNPNEENKIDFVVVTKSYTLSDTKSNVDEKTALVIGDNPMDNESEDWKQFIKNTKNLRESIQRNYFTTDFGFYQLICMKSNVGELLPEKIKIGDVPALYERKRKQVHIEEVNEDIQNYVNRIRACYSYQLNQKFEYLKIPEGHKVVTGDNWYIIFGEQGVLDGCYLTSDEYAEREYHVVMEQIKTNEQNLEEVIAKAK